MDKTITLSSLELKALIIFLEKYVNEENLHSLSSSEHRNLFIAYMKLKAEQEKERQALKYTE